MNKEFQRIERGLLLMKGESNCDLHSRTGYKVIWKKIWIVINKNGGGDRLWSVKWKIIDLARRGIAGNGRGRKKEE